MSLMELRTWLWQCDGCNYTDTNKSVAPKKPDNWTEVTVQTHINTTREMHFCSACSRKRAEMERAGGSNV